MPARRPPRPKAVSGTGSGARVDEPDGGSAATGVTAGGATTAERHDRVGGSEAGLVSGCGRRAPPTVARAQKQRSDTARRRPAEVASVPGPTPAATPVPHLWQREHAGADRCTARRDIGAPHAGEPAAPSAPSVAAPGASALDVEGLSGSISRPLSDGNGTYTVTVALHPPELGHLQAVVSLDGNDLQVSLTAQTQTGHDALANAADALKDQLARGGVNVNVDPARSRVPVGRGGAVPASHDVGRRRPSSPRALPSETPLPSGLAAGQIHLVL